MEVREDTPKGETVEEVLESPVEGGVEGRKNSLVNEELFRTFKLTEISVSIFNSFRFK